MWFSWTTFNYFLNLTQTYKSAHYFIIIVYYINKKKKKPHRPWNQKWHTWALNKHNTQTTQFLVVCHHFNVRLICLSHAKVTVLHLITRTCDRTTVHVNVTSLTVTTPPRFTFISDTSTRKRASNCCWSGNERDSARTIYFEGLPRLVSTVRPGAAGFCVYCVYLCAINWILLREIIEKKKRGSGLKSLQDFYFFLFTLGFLNLTSEHTDGLYDHEQTQ